MGKKSRQRQRSEDPGPAADGPGARQPCPCGSGRRYKACHGSRDSSSPYVARPFEGLPAEADLVALREFVPAATAPVELAPSVENPEGRSVQLCSLLPGATPAMVRQDGSIWLGLQVQHGYGDPSRDLGAVLEEALKADPGSLVGLSAPPGDGARLQDLLADAPVTVTVHEGFDYWVADVDDADGSMAGALEAANEAAAPTVRITAVPAAYWTSMGDREYLRWVLPHSEDRVLDALARLRVLGDVSLVEGDRLIGMFRTHGLVVPVWDLPVGTGAEALEEPLDAFSARFEEALGRDDALTSDERASRAGLASRQLTIR
ncbi:DUF5926 family protein [Nocardioides aurantiacus]|uniref:SEC-C motif-containing protein n=1 Tax=Nocardioides aurantiacus TaxID=86796 RepID=A0A3N2CP34_9ACTN|nr:DUF5926 family protein [Nocardioides aurantiacus]ROR89208.1 SEC-C motif-containing protein [Nocardioides aurantiacus]